MIRLSFISPLALLMLLTLPVVGCARRDCESAWQGHDARALAADGLGVNIHFTDPSPGELQLLADGGFRWVRMDLKWDATETVRGVYDFAAYDRLLTGLDQHKVRALFILDYTNPLYDHGNPPRTEEARQGFARWAVAAARHFAARGVLWEIYNEPNHSLFWPPRPNAGEYVALAQTVGQAFREAVPNEQLIGPATSEIDFDFLEACFKGGLLEYWSAVSVHPYRRSDPETVASDYCRLREMIRAYAPLQANRGAGQGAKKEIPIISGEWGYSAVWRGFDEEKQGQLLARSWLTNVANEVALSIWYDWCDDGDDANDAEHHFGAVHSQHRENNEKVLAPKPAYLAARTLSSLFRGYRFEQRLTEGTPEDFVLVFRKAGETRMAAWTTNTRPHQVMIPVETGKYHILKHTGQDAGELVAGQEGLLLTLTTAPIYLTR
jgi:hypothetical protein